LSINEDCLYCLVSNELMVQQIYKATVDRSNFYSYCVLGDQSSCCLARKDGTMLSVDDPVCTQGICSYNGPNITSTKIEEQYLFCNIQVQQDYFCGPSDLIVLNNSTEDTTAILILNNSSSQSNTTNTTGGDTTNQTSSSNTTNQTSSSNSTNQTSNSSTSSN